MAVDQVIINPIDGVTKHHGRCSGPSAGGAVTGDVRHSFLQNPLARLLGQMSTMPKRPRARSVRLCHLATAAAAAAALLDQKATTAAAAIQNEDDDIEVITLGAMQPPLLEHTKRPFGSSSGGLAGRPKEAAALEKQDESPEQTIDRLLRRIFERESQHLLEGEDSDLNPDVQPSAPPSVPAETHPMVQAGRPSRIRKEDERQVSSPTTWDAPEVGRDPQQLQQQEDESQEGSGGTKDDRKSGKGQPPAGGGGSSSNRAPVGDILEVAPPAQPGESGVEPRVVLVSEVQGVEGVDEEASYDALALAPFESIGHDRAGDELSRDEAVDPTVDEPEDGHVGAVEDDGAGDMEDVSNQDTVLPELDLTPNLGGSAETPVRSVTEEGEEKGEEVDTGANTFRDASYGTMVGARTAQDMVDYGEGPDLSRPAGTGTDVPVEAGASVVDTTAEERVRISSELSDGADGTRGYVAAPSVEDAGGYATAAVGEDAPLAARHGEAMAKIGESSGARTSADGETLVSDYFSAGKKISAVLGEQAQTPVSDVVDEELGGEAGATPEPEGVSAAIDTGDNSSSGAGSLTGSHDVEPVPGGENSSAPGLDMMEGPSNASLESDGEETESDQMVDAIVMSSDSESARAARASPGAVADDAPAVGMGAAVAASGDADPEDDTGRNAEGAPLLEEGPSNASLENDGEETESVQTVGAIVMSSDSESARAARASPGAVADDAPAVGIGAAVAASGDADPEDDTGGNAEGAPLEEPPTNDRRRSDARPPKEQRAVEGDGETTRGNVDMAGKTAPADDSAAAPQPLLPRVSEEDNAGVEEAEGGEEGRPRFRPVFHFSETLPSGTDSSLGADLTRKNLWNGEDGGGLALPPLPPIDIGRDDAAALGAEAEPGTNALVAYGSNGSADGWWEAWVKEAAAAARSKAIRWARSASDRGGELAQKSIDICLARMMKSWHETIGPQTERVRWRLEETANLCLAEVGEHLVDPVLAEAL